MGNMNVKFVNPLGEYSEKYGQRYYGKAHDIDMDISFNLMNPVNFEDGDEIEFESKEIKEKGPQSKNPGEEYLFLKKVKRSGSGEATSQTQSFEEKHNKMGHAVSSPATDLRGDAITASMAVKLAYVEFVRCEGQLPNDDTQWDVIESNARHLMEMVGRVKLPQKKLKKEESLKDKLDKGFTKDGKEPELSDDDIPEELA